MRASAEVEVPTFSLSSLALSKLFLSYRAGYKVAMLERHSFSIFYHLAIEFIYLEMLVRVSTIFLFQDRILKSFLVCQCVSTNALK